MENEYNYLEKKLGENNISNIEKMKLLERQKELLLQFLVDSNIELFKIFRKKERKPMRDDVFLLANPINHNPNATER